MEVDEGDIIVSNEGLEVSDEGMYSIESMCPVCQANGQTRLLRVKIPFFRDIMVMSFQCGECGHRNNETQSVTSIQPWGERISLEVSTKEDLDRQIVKSEYASTKIPNLEFEIPPVKQKAIVSTVQGVLTQAADGLTQSMRNNNFEPEVLKKLTAITMQIRAYSEGDFTEPFVFEIDDPAGNSYIENPTAPEKDPLLSTHRYERTIDQTHAMGFYEEQSGPAADIPANKRPDVQTWDLKHPLTDDLTELDKSSAEFQFPCPSCGKTGSQKMCLIDIPGFRECWIMSFICDFCGARSNELKPAGSIGDKARRFTLTATDLRDLSRDILKSDSSAIQIPELELELEAGTLGGVFTTLEGMLLKIAEELADKFPFVGDSQLEERKQKLITLVEKLKKLACGESFPFTFVLDDPADMSHIGRREDDKKETSEDPNLTQEVYERTDAQNDDLGLKDMKVENYETQ